ncbi:hypothetical protein YC2023_093146 [Brassica napus]
MANPWFPANSASALSPSRLTPGDSRLLTPPDPPDPDPDNPLSLARFPPLNSPSPPATKSSKTSRHRKGKEPEASVNVPAKDSSSTFVEEVSVDPPARSVVLASSSSQPPDPLPCSLPPLEKPTPIFPFSLPHSPQKYPHIKPNHPSHPPILMPSLPSPHKPLSLFVSPTSPPEQPKKRPRPCSTQTFPSFTDQLNFFSVPKSPIRPPLLLPPAPSDILSFGSNPFAILSSQGPLPSEEVID